ncbi:MAG: hypothetical protein HDR80_05940 [Bacteroides sp.]|nr:hypothetical protein [Bacteroides sp.]
MTAKDVLSVAKNMPALRTVDASMPLLEVLPALLDAPGRLLGVADHGGEALGTIDEISLLEGLGRLIAERDDSSVLMVECAPQDYSASLLARAVEDADAHIVDLISHPAADGQLHVTLRVRTLNPTAAVHSLERYGFRVIETSAHEEDSDAALLSERLASLQALLSV